MGDVDNDGDLDVFMARLDEPGAPNQVWLNNGRGTLNDSGQRLGNSKSERASLADLDGDGDLDAFEVNCCGQTKKVWINTNVYRVYLPSVYR